MASITVKHLGGAKGKHLFAVEIAGYYEKHLEVLTHDVETTTTELLKRFHQEVSGHPREHLVDLAIQDLPRVRAICYRKAGLTPESYLETNLEVLHRQVGPKVFVGAGYNVFKFSYLCAEDALYKMVVPQLTEQTALDLELHHGFDSDLNWRGDWVWFKWRILRK